MKKIYLFIILVAVLFTACEKDQKDEAKPDNPKKYKVVFNAQLFDQSTGDFKSGSPSRIFVDPMPTLYTRVYNLDEDGQKLYDYSTLPPGNYVAVFVASNHWFYRHSDFGEMGGDGYDDYFEYAHLDTRTSVELIDVPIEDIFYKKLYFTVTNKDINQTVILNRLVAGLEVIIEDEIPAIVTTLELTVADDASFYFHDDHTEDEVYKISTFSRNERLTAFVLGMGSRSLMLKAFDSGGNLINERYLGATFHANKKTTLSGKLFNDPGVLFTVDVNSNWDTPPSTIPF